MAAFTQMDTADDFVKCRVVLDTVFCYYTILLGNRWNVEVKPALVSNYGAGCRGTVADEMCRRKQLTTVGEGAI